MNKYSKILHHINPKKSSTLKNFSNKKRTYEEYEAEKKKTEVDILKEQTKQLTDNIDFLQNFDLKILEDTYYRMIYKYSEELGKNIIFCKRPSFNKYIHNSKPYYTSTEVINMALNMGNKIDINDKIMADDELRIIFKIFNVFSSNTIELITIIIELQIINGILKLLQHHHLEKVIPQVLLPQFAHQLFMQLN